MTSTRRGFLSVICAAFGAAAARVFRGPVGPVPEALPVLAPLPVSDPVAEILQVGDVFYIQGVNMLNPLNREETGLLQYFVYNGKGQFHPQAIADGPYRNVNRVPDPSEAKVPLGYFGRQ